MDLSTDPVVEGAVAPSAVLSRMPDKVDRAWRNGCN